METHDAQSISGRIVAEFDDDATEFLSGEPEYVPQTEIVSICFRCEPVQEQNPKADTPA